MDVTFYCILYCTRHHVLLYRLFSLFFGRRSFCHYSHLDHFAFLPLLPRFCLLLVHPLFTLPFSCSWTHTHAITACFCPRFRILPPHTPARQVHTFPSSFHTLYLVAFTHLSWTTPILFPSTHTPSFSHIHFLTHIASDILLFCTLFWCSSRFTP